MVGREMQFIATCVAREGRAPDARAVDEDVQRLSGGKEPRGEGIDRGRIEQVHRLDLDVDPAKPGRGLVAVARRHDHPGAGGSQRTRGFHADAGMAAGHDRDLAGQVDALDNVVGGGRGVEAGTDGFLQSGYSTQLLNLN